MLRYFIEKIFLLILHPEKNYSLKLIKIWQLQQILRTDYV